MKIGRPKTPKSQHKRQLSISVTPEMMQELAAYSKDVGKSKSEAIAEAWALSLCGMGYKR